MTVVLCIRCAADRGLDPAKQTIYGKCPNCNHLDQISTYNIPPTAKGKAQP